MTLEPTEDVVFCPAQLSLAPKEERWASRFFYSPARDQAQATLNVMVSNAVLTTVVSLCTH